MADYETEEQTIEALKKWWHENGTSLIFGTALGLAGLGGYQYYVESEYSRATEASDTYTRVTTAIESGRLDGSVEADVDLLTSDYADTPYAALAALSIARMDFESGDAAAAISRLQWVKANSPESDVRIVAVLRLARIHIDQGDFDSADNELQTVHPEAYSIAFEELRGDVYVARQEIEKARAAYDRAIELSDTPNHWLKLKRQDLGEMEMVSSAS